MAIKIGQSTWIQVTNNSAFYLHLRILKHKGSIEESCVTLKVTSRPASASVAGKNFATTSLETETSSQSETSPTKMTSALLRGRLITTIRQSGKHKTARSKLSPRYIGEGPEGRNSDGGGQKG